MKKKLSPEKLIVIVGIIFATVLVLVNVFFDFVPHTVKTENIKSAKMSFPHITMKMWIKRPIQLPKK